MKGKGKDIEKLMEKYNDRILYQKVKDLTELSKQKTSCRLFNGNIECRTQLGDLYETWKQCIVAISLGKRQNQNYETKNVHPL